MNSTSLSHTRNVSTILYLYLNIEKRSLELVIK